MVPAANRSSEPSPGPKSKIGDREFINAVLYRAKTGVPWRDLPERFGPWKSIYNRFAHWADPGVWELIFKALQLEHDEIGSIIDGTVVRAHQDASGARGGIQCNALGRSRGGFSSKLPALVDTQGRPLHIALPPGNMHDSMMAQELIAHARLFAHRRHWI